MHAAEILFKWYSPRISIDMSRCSLVELDLLILSKRDLDLLVRAASHAKQFCILPSPLIASTITEASKSGSTPRVKRSSVLFTNPCRIPRAVEKIGAYDHEKAGLAVLLPIAENTCEARLNKSHYIVQSFGSKDKGRSSKVKNAIPKKQKKISKSTTSLTIFSCSVR